jgi:hypothetical protein
MVIWFIIRTVQKLHIGCFNIRVCCVPIQCMFFSHMIVCGILMVLFSDSVWFMVCYLLWILFHYYIKYCVFSNSTSVINLYALFCFLVDVEFLNCIQMSIMSCIWLKEWPWCIKCWITVLILVRWSMFFKPCLELSTSLSSVDKQAVLAP